MKKLFTIFIIVVNPIFNILISQVNTDWVSKYPGPNTFYTEYPPMVIDSSGNVYVTGSNNVNGTNDDYATIKYNSLGIQQWASRYNGPGNSADRAISIAVDRLGNVYVTGYSNSDYLTIKYSSLGDSIWVRRYNNIGDDVAYSITVDDSENVYVTGASIGSGTNYDYLTIKYNILGSPVWIRRYNSPNNSGLANSILVDKMKNVYVTGSTNDITTIKYNSLGDSLWVRHFGFDTPHMVLDDSGNVYVTGTSHNSSIDYGTVKYNSLGTSQWSSIYDRTGGNDYPNSIAIDKFGNVFVTGISTTSNNDMTTIKYNPVGVLQWSKSYDGSSHNYDRGSSVVTDTLGNIYVTGISTENDGGVNYLTAKYDSFGNEYWLKNYNGAANSTDQAGTIRVSPNGNKIYVTGFETGSSGNFITTIQYSPQIVYINLNLKILLEGMYSSIFDLLTRRDSVTAYLRNVTPPFAIVDSAKSIIDSINFTGRFKFTNEIGGTYYIVAKHFNSIETWSKSGGEGMSNTDTTYYDVTTSSSQAYGNNLKLKGSKYCLFSGDVNQDGAVNLTDLISVYNRARHFDTGDHLPEDLTGDSVVDLSDLTLCYNNSASFVRLIRP